MRRLSTSLICLFFFIFYNSHSSLSSLQCHLEESSALVQFKTSFPFRITWNESIDCCKWNGITCDEETGHIISLDMSNSGLHGTISSNSSLFFLRHLRSLDLSFNDFRGSSIVPEFGHFKDLQHLSLFQANFSGDVPLEISHLSKLVSLKLSQQSPYLDGSELKIGAATFKALARNLTSLEELWLDGNDLSLVPSVYLMNLSSSLKSLSLSYCNLNGNLTVNIFRLPKLTHLDLSNNYLGGQMPLEADNFPSSLEDLDLSNNLLNGPLPSWVYEMPNLYLLDLSFNAFSGKISAFQTMNLSRLDLSYNSLTVTMEFVELSKLEKLSYLSLSSNKLSLFSSYSIYISFPKLQYLDLSSCNLVEFPNFFPFLKNNIKSIDLSSNKIHGSVPKRLWDIGKDSINFLNLSYNSLTYMEPLSWNKLMVLDLRSNKFSGLVPFSSAPLLKVLLASKNQFMGHIPTSFCNMTNLMVLDLSYNNLSGKLPSCLGNFSKELLVLDLRSNRLHGDIDLTFAENTSLRSLNFNGNQLEGTVPKSLMHCRNLEVLDLGNNLLEGKFPIWLESLPNLQVLVLRSNKFHGSIANPKTDFPFHALRIMCISSNEFTGVPPMRLFQNFKAMMNAEHFTTAYVGSYHYYQYSITVTMKGLEIELVKILTVFTAIDFSINNFIGEIPELIGKLKLLKGLNLSHNKITGPIPTSLGNLSNLEWLDLSSNNLVGNIPSQLASNLYQLEFINLSNNGLVGPIPRGPQFDTFNNDSYRGNLGLCGFPLSKSCSVFTPKHDDDDDDDNEDDDSGFLVWTIVVMGYSCGVVIGVSLGYIVLFSPRFDYWLAERIGSKQMLVLKAKEIHRKFRALWTMNDAKCEQVLMGFASD